MAAKNALPVVHVMAEAVAALGLGACAAWLQSGVEEPLLSTGGTNLVVKPMALLLVVRTKIAYDKFWAVRTSLGDLVLASQSLSRLSVTFLGPPEVSSDARAVLGASAALYESIVQDVATARRHRADDRAVLTAALALSSVVAAAQRRGRLQASVAVEFERRAAAMVSVHSALVLHRLVHLPASLAHLLHLLLAIYAFVVVPLTVAVDYGWATPAVTTVTAVALLGINDVGLRLEDPIGRDGMDVQLHHFRGRGAAAGEALADGREGRRCWRSRGAVLH